MTRVGRRLIEDFLLPALNDQRYGDLLKWIDRDKYFFSIRWSHKNAAKWTLQDTAVFQDWDKLKGHYRPEIKGYYMQAKQRFRAALYKLNTVRKLPCDDKHVKIYQLVLDDKKSGINCMNKSRVKIKQLLIKNDESQKSIPTSVICKNSAYIAKQDDSSEPSSPIISVKTEVLEPSESSENLVMSIDFDEKPDKETNLVQNPVPQSVWHSQKPPHIKTEFLKSKLSHRQVSPPTLGQRTPHVPIQPLPVYNKCRQQVLCAPQRRFESPHLLLVPIYNTNTSAKGFTEKPENYSFSCSHQTKPSSDVALNLTLKPKSAFLNR